MQESAHAMCQKVSAAVERSVCVRYTCVQYTCTQSIISYTYVQVSDNNFVVYLGTSLNQNYCSLLSGRESRIGRKKCYVHFMHTCSTNARISVLVLVKNCDDLFVFLFILYFFFLNYSTSKIVHRYISPPSSFHFSRKRFTIHLPTTS